MSYVPTPCQLYLGNPEAEPEAWDWQNEPHNKFRVFTPFQSSEKVNQPSFMKINRNITVTLGETAYLPCRVKNLNDYTVSSYLFLNIYNE